MKRLLPVIRASGAAVPWSNLERAHAITKLYAGMRRYGSGTTFLSWNLDDVNHPTVMRLSVRSCDNTNFPCDPSVLLRYLKGEDIDDEERLNLAQVIAGREDATIEVALSEVARQRLANNSPVAAASVFHMLTESMMTDLIGLPPSKHGPGRIGRCSRSTEEPLQRARGAAGKCRKWEYQIETDGRQSFHIHGTIHGGADTTVLQTAAGIAAFERAVCAVLDSQYHAELAPELLALHSFKQIKGLLLASRKVRLRRISAILSPRHLTPPLSASRRPSTRSPRRSWATFSRTPRSPP